jgi:hypothetical protein
MLSSTQRIKVHGIPGEEQTMLVIFRTADHPYGSRPISVPGKFRVQFLFSRPGRAQFAETEPTFLSDIVGDSHIGIAKPANDRSDDDIESLKFLANGDGWSFEFKGFVNERGYLGKMVVELAALNTTEAERIAYRALSPFLSTWSMTLDVPVNIETVQVTDLSTHTDTLQIRAPFVEMRPGSGVGPMLSDEFCQYSSLYREALNSTSPFYRFLCLYKLIESIYFRRTERARLAKEQGQSVKTYADSVYLNREAMTGILLWIYPWRNILLDDLAIAQTLPSEADGKKFTRVREEYLRPLRDGIAHGLMDSGEIRTVADRLEDVDKVRKWSPLLRVWSQLLMRLEFPEAFSTV